MSTSRVLICIGGGIAAYKVCEVISTLFQAGSEVKCILTEAATEFITPLTVATLSRHQVYTDRDFWQPQPRPLHIDLGEWADLILIAPLTANTLGKLAYGLADNLLTNTILASRCPVLLAPAMNTDMWLQASVQQNWQQIKADVRYHHVGPGAGRLACDRVGTGRMAEPVEIISSLHSLLHSGGKRDLQDKRVLVSAGGTKEYLDPVRYLGNPATGKMGVAIATAAATRGAKVTLVHANVDLGAIASNEKIATVAVTDAQQMQQAMLAGLTTADWIVMNAAVADVKPADYSHEKLPKANLPQCLPLAPVPDIVAQLAQQKNPNQRLIGFAAQTGDIVKPAWEKLQRKGLDAIAANPIDKSEVGFGGDKNEAVLLDCSGRKQAIEPCSKLTLAHRLLDFIATIPLKSDI